MNRIAKSALFASVFLFVAVSVSALSWIVPGVANVTGLNGAQYGSVVTLTNPGSLPATLTLSLIPAPGTPRVLPVSFTIEAASTRVVTLDSAWQVEGSGALRIEASFSIDIFARTHTVFVSVLPLYGGTSLPVIEESQLLAAGDVGHSAWVEQTAAPTSSRRTNVAVTFPGPEGGAAEATLYDETGKTLGVAHFESSEPAFLQLPLTAFGPTNLALGRVAIRITRGTGCGYTALIGSGGDIAILAAEALPPPPKFPAMSELISIGVAQTPGVNGSFWQTDARLANPGPDPVAVNAYLLTGGGPTAAASTLFIPAGQTVEIRNLVQSLFNESGAAAGAVLWRASRPISVGTFTRNSSAGNFNGAASAAVPVERFSSAEDPPPEITELLSGYARTNLLAVAGPGGAAYDLDAYSMTGQLVGTIHEDLPPLAASVLALSALAAGDPQLSRVRARVSSGTVHLEAAIVGIYGGDLVFAEGFPRGSAASSGNPPIPAGSWGGAPNGTDHVTVDSTTIQIFRHCQIGNFPQPRRLEPGGRFAVLGTYGITVGPSIQLDAILSGRLTGTSLTLQTFPLPSSFDGGVDTSPETFVLGAPFQPDSGFCPVEY